MNRENIEHIAATRDAAAILRRALETLQALVPFEYEIEPFHDVRGHEYDYIVRAQIFGAEIIWCVEVKNRFTKTEEVLARIKKDKAPHPFLLVTRYIPPEAAIRLRDAGIQFIDTAGNAFVNQPPLLIFVKGNRQIAEEPTIPTVPAARLFKGVGLKIAYLLLCRPELADRPYRDLVEMTHVALGTVNGAMAEMVEKGFILDMGRKGKKLRDRKALFERWITAYPDFLKPKLLLGRFQGNGEWWKNAQLDPTLAQWGGEVAAAKLTGYLKPGTVTLYTDKKHLADLVIANRLKKDPQGNVEILERFWPPEHDFGEGDAVHPILIYADLVAVGEQRTMETARIIYDKFLNRYFEQD